MKGLIKIEKLLLAGFLVLIPTQLGKHWWIEWSLVNGIRVDYLSPALYLTDVVWISLVIVVSFHTFSGPVIRSIRTFGMVVGDYLHSRRPPTENRSSAKVPSKVCKEAVHIAPARFSWVIIGVVVAGINIVTADNWQAAGYGWLRWLQWGLTIKLIYDLRFKISIWWDRIALGWVAAETGLGLAQVVSGRTVQGVFYWLGERKIDMGTIGAATWSVLGEERLRAYGTFSHPNSLAGFLGLVWLINWQKKKKDIYWWLITLVGGLGIGLTGGRTVVAVVLGMLVIEGVWKVVKDKNKEGWRQAVVVGITLAAGVGLVVSGKAAGWDEEGLNKRWELMRAAGEMIKDNPLLGVGLNNYLVKLPSYWDQSRIWLQPVHNVVLLIVSEIGLVGMGLLMWGLVTRFKIMDLRSWNKTKVLVVLFLLLTGAVDHYWLTLVQNRWLLAVVLGLLW